MRVTFLDSIQGHQTERIRAIADRLRRARPDLTVELITGDAAKASLAQHKLNFGPGIVIDGRLEYVGIPRWRFLQERLAQVGQRLANPRTAAPPESAKPAAARPAPAPRAAPKPPPASSDSGPTA